MSLKHIHILLHLSQTVTGEEPCKSILVYGHEAARNYLGLYTLRENKVKGFWSYISPDGDYIIRVNDDLDEWIVEQMDFGRVEGGRRFYYYYHLFILKIVHLRIW